MYKVAFKADGKYQLIGWYCSVTDGTVADDKNKNMRQACYEEQYDFGCVCGRGGGGGLHRNAGT